MAPVDIGGHQLASLHAFDIDEAQAVAGVNRHGNGAAAGHRIALLAWSERAHARPQNGRRLRRSWPDTLVAGKNQLGAPSLKWTCFRR